MSSGGDFFLGLLAVLFPPIAVWIKRGLCSCDSLLNLALCMLGYIPGLLHAWYIIIKYPDEPESYAAVPQDAESQHHVTYYYVAVDGGLRPQDERAQVPKPTQGTRAEQGYGTVGPSAGQGQGRAEQGYGTVGPSAGQGEGSQGGGVPPSYAEAIRGDHKVQT